MHWRLLEILQRRQVAEISPIELEAEITPVMTGEALAEAPPSAAESADAAESEPTVPVPKLSKPQRMPKNDPDLYSAKRGRQ